MWDEERDELDQVLNQALSVYSAEPLLGIEARILRRARTEGRAAHGTGLASFSWSRAVGVAVTVALIAAGVFLSRNGVVEKAANPNQPAAERPVTGAEAPGATRENREVEGTIRVRARRSALPKLDVFPTPSPLTPEELALVKMAKAVPSGAKARPEKASTVQVEPIQIQALEIKPLLMDGDEEGDKKER